MATTAKETTATTEAAQSAPTAAVKKAAPKAAKKPEKEPASKAAKTTKAATATKAVKTTKAATATKAAKTTKAATATKTATATKAATATKTAAKKATASKTTKAGAKSAVKSGNLVIVESPAKAKTITKFLGKGYKVIASYGHVMDLPKSTLGVDVEQDFLPKYIKLKGKADVINAIKKEAKLCNKVFLATDPDREGEAISWHLAKLLDMDESQDCRIEFNEITPTAIKNAIAKPRPINMALVDAQQARRILDRLVGYKISPILWAKVRKGLSAGRVQSVATRIVVDREEEIRAFTPEEYWSIEAHLSTPREKTQFVANFRGQDGKKIAVTNAAQALEIATKLQNAAYMVTQVKQGEKSRSGAAPFTTSNLQQEASRKYNYATKRTMSIAQSLYEGVDIGKNTVGLVTYIRTDSVRVSDDALSAVRAHIVATYGEKYLPATPKVYKGKKGAQDAHEAIRPTHLEINPEDIKGKVTLDQYKLYKLIYNRFVASQMNNALYATTTASILAAGYDFRASGSRMLFDGFMKVYTEGVDEEVKKEGVLPELLVDDALNFHKLDQAQHFTQPPPRYTEATLVRALEEKGIGRPSTYAPTISTIIDRLYIERDKKQLSPTELGELVTQILKGNFQDIVDVDFTAHMEEELDEVEDGKRTYQSVLRQFYDPFAKTLEIAEQTIEKIIVEPEISDIKCDKCDTMMVYKIGRFGKFLACPNYPQCKNTKQVGETEEESDKICDKCGANMKLKTGRFGKFYACPNYPECKNTMPFEAQPDAEAPCPKCGGKVQKKRSKKGTFFFGCSKYPDCDFVSWDEPILAKCPNCQQPMFKKVTKNGEELRCNAQGCGYKQKLEGPKKDEA